MKAVRSFLKYRNEIQGTEHNKDEHHGQQKPVVSDTVDDEGLFARICGCLVLIPETDQQIAAQPHTFPSHEHE